MENSFKKLFSVGEYKDLDYFCDAQLLTEDDWSFDVHRIILAKESMYFRALFRNCDKTQAIFYIRGITGTILDQILCYIYVRTLPHNRENDLDLLIASDFFLVDSLMLCIKKHLMRSISAENVLRMYMVSLKISDTELLKFSYRYIQTHFQALISNNRMNFQEISFEFLKIILNDNSLCVTGEHTVWKCIEKWVKIDPLCRLSLLPKLLNCLKTADIDESLANEIIRSDIMCKNPLYEDLIGTEYLSQSNCSLVVLKNIIRNSTFESTISVNQFQSHRHPKYLHIIAENNEGIQILYMSYDENIDLWRRLGETDRFINATFLAVVGLKVYILDEFCNRCMVFDLCTKQWSEMLQPQIERRRYKAVKLGSRIFIIGGKLQTSNQDTTSVEFYDTEQGRWFDSTPMMMPVSEFRAVSYQNKIFVFGCCRVTQVYDADLNKWSFFTPPNFYEAPFAIFIEYHGKLYTISGYRECDRIKRKVEVYDTATDSWDLTSDLPADFEPCSALVLQDQLIVFDLDAEDDIKLPKSPVTWNEEEGLWKPLDKSFLWYGNCIADSMDSDVEISAMVKELRDPATSFEKSPFK